MPGHGKNKEVSPLYVITKAFQGEWMNFMPKTNEI
jgi:hypothetical protein